MEDANVMYYAMQYVLVILVMKKKIMWSAQVWNQFWNHYLPKTNAYWKYGIQIFQASAYLAIEKIQDNPNIDIDTVLRLCLESCVGIPYVGSVKTMPYHPDMQDFKSTNKDRETYLLLKLLKDINARCNEYYSVKWLIFVSPTEVISMIDYVERIQHNLTIDESIINIARVYANRVFKCDPELFSERRGTKIFAIVCVMAVKYQCEGYFKTQWIADVVGLSVEQLNKMFCLLWKLMDFNLFVHPDELESVACFDDHISKSRF